MLSIHLLEALQNPFRFRALWFEIHCRGVCWRTSEGALSLCSVGVRWAHPPSPLFGFKHYFPLIVSKYPSLLLLVGLCAMLPECFAYIVSYSIFRTKLSVGYSFCFPKEGTEVQRCYNLSKLFSCNHDILEPSLPTLPGKSHGWRSLEGCSPWGC